MMEWEVVGVIIALIGLFSAVGAPVIRLNTSITKLIENLDNLKNEVETVTKHNTDSHRRLWLKNEEQDSRLNDHESRIRVLERGERND